MERLLSPNETKFWLMDVLAPMNVIAAVHLDHGIDEEFLSAKNAFQLPCAKVGKHNRPRWSAARTAGTIEVLAVDDPHDNWLQHAEQLLEVRVGTEGFPSFHACVLQAETKSTLLLAMNHALVDYRTALSMAKAFLEGSAPDDQALSLEEMLPVEEFGRSDAEEVIDSWWSQRSSVNWEAAGLDKLTSFLPESGSTRLRSFMFSRAQTAVADQYCKQYGANLNAVVAVAIHRSSGIGEISHSIDMTRFIQSDAAPGPGLAISHLFTDVPDGEFWSSAKNVRDALFHSLSNGDAADALLVLPLALKQGRIDDVARPTRASVTNAPVQRLQTSEADCSTLHLDVVSQCVVSAARGGGFIINIGRVKDRLQLIACLRTEDGDEFLDGIADQILKATDRSTRALP